MEFTAVDDRCELVAAAARGTTGPPAVLGPDPASALEGVCVQFLEAEGAGRGDRSRRGIGERGGRQDASGDLANGASHGESPSSSRLGSKLSPVPWHSEL